jgi:putative chitinase
MIDRTKFFDAIQAPLFGGGLTREQVDGIDYLLNVWERHFEQANPRDGTRWLSYCLATVYHETARTMEPIEEYGKGKGKPYGNPKGPHGHAYYGRGYPQLTHEENYIKGERRLKDIYEVEAALHKEPHRMLEHEISALVLYDGMINGWFTGVGLSKYFNPTVEDPVNARRIVNGLDKADTIAGYYWKFKSALA